MKHRRWLGAALALTLAPLAALAGDISGTWKASFDTQIGKQEYTYELTVKGKELTGKAKSSNGETDLAEGKVENDTVSFVENLNYQGQALRIAYTGKIVSDTEIRFTRDVAGFAKEELVATRSK